MAAIATVTAPVVEPVGLDEVKAHLRVDIRDDDPLITTLIQVARERIEDEARHYLMTQTLDYSLDEFPGEDVLVMPLVPLQAVTAISYYDTAGVGVTVSSASYQVDTASRPARIALNRGYAWPTTPLRTLNGVVVRVVVGFGSTFADVPAQLRQALLLLVGHYYENREAAIISGAVPQQLPFAVAAICRQYRMLAYRM